MNQREEFEFFCVTTEVKLSQYEMLLIKLGLKALNYSKRTENLEQKIKIADEHLENELKKLREEQK